MNFSLEQLNAFVTVYEQASFSKAATKLNKHRTTMGQVISNLEDQLAIKVFERIGRSVKPTEDGELLYRYAKQAIEQARTFDRVALSLSYGGLESVTIAYCSFLPNKVLTDIRVNLAKSFPSMRVNFLVRTKPEIKKGIQDGSIHFGMVNVHQSTLINSIDYILLNHIAFAPFVGKSHPIAAMPISEQYGALKTSRQLVLKSLIDDEMGEKVILSPNYEVIEQLSLIVKFVEQGLGWSLLPTKIIQAEYLSEHLLKLSAEQLKDDLKIPVALWCPHSKQITKVKENIVATISQYTQ